MNIFTLKRRMIMKNKLILLLLVLVALVVTLAACGGTAETTANETTTVPVVKTTPLDGDNAMAAYEYVSEKMNALKGFEATLIEEQTVGFNNTKLEMVAKINLLDGKKGFISTKLDDKGSTLDMTYIDGVVYCLMKSTGVEMKYKTQDGSLINSFEEMFNSFEEDEESKIESVSFGERENGVYTLTATFAKEKALKVLMKQYEELGIDESALTDVKYTAVVTCNADGYATRVTQTITYTLQGMACSVISDGIYTNVGTLPEITAPADAYSYADADEME